MANAEEAFEEKPEVFVLGNGNSMKDFDFTKLKDKTTIGCCLAYRYWEKIDWFPTFYVNVDSVVLKAQEEEIRNLIDNKKCQGFLISKTVLETWSDFKIEDFPTIFFVEDLRLNPYSLFKNVVNYCSGSVAALFACDIGSKVHLLGFDVDYVELIPECIEKEDGTLIITETPEKNPNYFFDDYQRMGDNYNKPNGTRVHLRSWEELSYILDFINKMFDVKIPIKNYNDKKSISDFLNSVPLNNIYDVLK